MQEDLVVSHHPQFVPSTLQWGPALWRAVHFVALGYPATPSGADRVSYRAFFEHLPAVIPCSICSKNYERHLTELPIDDALAKGGFGPGTLFEWTVRLHNLVNAELGKPDRDWSIERAAAELFYFSSAQTAQPPMASSSAPAAETRDTKHWPSASTLALALAAVLIAAAVLAASLAFSGRPRAGPVSRRVRSA